MATPTKVTEPATPVDAVTDPAIPDVLKYDPRKLVYVYDSDTGKKLDRPVPQTWLDGRFPHLSETPSKKAGK